MRTTVEELSSHGVGVRYAHTVLAELIAEKPGSSDGDMTVFATMKEGEYILADPAKSDIGIVVPDVPEGCDDDTKSAQAALQAFFDELEDRVTYYDFLQELLQVCCEEIEVELNGLTGDANGRIDVCAADTFAVLSDLSDLSRPVDVLFEIFTQELRADYTTQVDAGEIDAVETGIDIPTLPVNLNNRRAFVRQIRARGESRAQWRPPNQNPNFSGKPP